MRIVRNMVYSERMNSAATLRLPPRASTVAAEVPAPARRRPPQDGNGSHDGLSPVQRRLMVGSIAAAHVVAVWALLQVREVRDAVAEVAPMFVSIVAPPAPPKIEPPPPPPMPVQRRVTPPPRVIAAAPTPAPAPFVVPAPPEVVEPAPPQVVAAPAPVVAAPAPPAPAPPPPAPAPKVIPASEVEYLEPIEIVYPRLSIRMGETGTVMVRLLIDPTGMPRDVQVSRSSGHARLDDAAIAAVKKARFKPPTENGRPVAGVTNVPVNFQLEK